jgi:hypothetical protein
VNIARQSFITALLIYTAAGCASQPRQAALHEPSLGLTQENDASSALGLKGPATTPIAASASSRQPWQFGDVQGMLITSPNYRIYTTIEYDRILDRLPVFYERALQQYTSALANLPMPDEHLETYLFQTRSQWQTKTEQMLPDQAKMFSNLGRGGFTTHGTSVLYYIDRMGYTRDTFAIAAHEGWHQYTQQTFKHQLPIWLEEGVATYMEGYRTNSDGEPEFMPKANFERRETLKDAARSHKLITLDDLLTRTPQSFLNQGKEPLLVYYAQVWALTRFLSEGENGKYKSALADVLTDAAEGKLVGRMMTSPVTANSRHRGAASNHVGPAVAQEYFNRDLAELQQQYLSFVDQITNQENQPSGRRR